MNAMTKNDVFHILHQNKTELQAFGVKRLGLFGSFVRGQERPDSDIDLLVEFEPGEKTFDHFMALSFYLEEVLGRRVEVVTPESLSPYMAAHILSEVEDAALVA
ncbi:MAG: nucleotidyltransferase family protein [Syntrophorhabdaceae bacterium]|nr:nucleotidyltransferase family protein [Syntrophorhabdaceae bacterium]HBL24632.1 nucleotidyltransferase [Deltaproteobacteria bacterium]